METINTTNDSPSLPLHTDVSSEQTSENSIETSKEKIRKKRNSALQAAAIGRSAVQHVHNHIITNRPGDFAHTATNISYED